jgi:hypothetical protein
MAMIGPRKGTVNNPRGINQWSHGGSRGGRGVKGPTSIRGPMDIAKPSFAGKPAHIGGARAVVTGAATRVKMAAKSASSFGKKVGGKAKAGASTVASKARGADVPGLKIRSRIAGANVKRKSTNYATGTTARGRMATRIKSGAKKLASKARGADIPGLKIRSRLAGASAKRKAKNYATNTTARGRMAARAKSAASNVKYKAGSAIRKGIMKFKEARTARKVRKSLYTNPIV